MSGDRWSSCVNGDDDDDEVAAVVPAVPVGTGGGNKVEWVVQEDMGGARRPRGVGGTE